MGSEDREVDSFCPAIIKPKHIFCYNAVHLWYCYTAKDTMFLLAIILFHDTITKNTFGFNENKRNIIKIIQQKWSGKKKNFKYWNNMKITKCKFGVPYITI